MAHESQSTKNCLAPKAGGLPPVGHSFSDGWNQNLSDEKARLEQIKNPSGLFHWGRDARAYIAKRPLGALRQHAVNNTSLLPLRLALCAE